ncbi:MAG TPA: hypothetical protein VFF67_01105 [Thermoplasmata archaeon]|nr:hypothetical protein [Thermoplasmata archaeon]
MAAATGSGESPSAPTADETMARRELGVRRVDLYIAIFFAAAITGVIMEESDNFLHLIDDIGLVSLSVVVIVLIAVWWKRQTLGELRRTNTTVAVVFIVALVIQLFGIAVEYNDPMDFGNDIPSLIGLILVIINRFA